MKLNEKGLAFSTMLYGSITVITLVLYVILNIYKSSNDNTYYFGEEILKDLNKCITEEINLENCYSSGSNNCDTTAYRSCLGVRSGTENQGTIISESLKEVQDSGLIQDTYENNRYIYVGSSPKNYLQYSNKLWRIVSIEPGGLLKIIDTNKYANVAWDIAGSGSWGDGSTLYNSLNLNYLSSIEDTSKLISGIWYKSLIYPSLGNPFDLNNLLVQERAGGSEIVEAAKVGILSISDYIKAADNNNCKNNILGENAYDCNSWLVEYKGWTIDINGEFGSSSNGYAFYFGDDNTNNNKVLYKSTSSIDDVYPVVILNRNSVIQSGTGTESNPYILK